MVRMDKKNKRSLRTIKNTDKNIWFSVFEKTVNLKKYHFTNRRGMLVSHKYVFEYNTDKLYQDFRLTFLTWRWKCHECLRYECIYNT